MWIWQGRAAGYTSWDYGDGPNRMERKRGCRRVHEIQPRILAEAGRVKTEAASGTKVLPIDTGYERA